MTEAGKYLLVVWDVGTFSSLIPTSRQDRQGELNSTVSSTCIVLQDVQEHFNVTGKNLNNNNVVVQENYRRKIR